MTTAAEIQSPPLLMWWPTKASSFWRSQRTTTKSGLADLGAICSESLVSAALSAEMYLLQHWSQTSLSRPSWTKSRMAAGRHQHKVFDPEKSGYVHFAIGKRAASLYWGCTIIQNILHRLANWFLALNLFLIERTARSGYRGRAMSLRTDFRQQSQVAG